MPSRFASAALFCAGSSLRAMLSDPGGSGQAWRFQFGFREAAIALDAAQAMSYNFAASVVSPDDAEHEANALPKERMVISDRHEPGSKSAGQFRAAAEPAGTRFPATTGKAR